MKSRAAYAVVAGAVVALVASGAAAEMKKITLTVAAGQATRAMKPLAMVGEFFIPEVNKRVKAANLPIEIEWKEAYAGSLLQPLQMLDGVKDGIADIGFTPTIFYPDKLPLENISFVVPFTTSDVKLVSKAVNHLHDTIPDYTKQYDKFNQIWLGGDSYDSYELVTNFPVHKLADMKGRKIGTAGAALAWLRGTGATPVQSNMMEYYNSIKTGVFDGCIIFASSFPGMKYPEVAPYTIKVGFGAQYAAALLMNKDSYKKVPPALQKILREAGHAWGAAADQAMVDAGQKGLTTVASFKGQVIDFPRDEQVKWAKAMPNIAKEWAAKLDKDGLPGSKALSAYMDEMRKNGAKPARNWDKE
ncbi:MAG: C4-dicarboxylate TRAP transporter substrate-binding protein [Candidatus Eiseniibacteriota bacterium]